MDRNISEDVSYSIIVKSLSARRAWIEMIDYIIDYVNDSSLSARRAWIEIMIHHAKKKSTRVALRKESVDRNCCYPARCVGLLSSLSARRAWIEIMQPAVAPAKNKQSLSARRAWIEIFHSQSPGIPRGPSLSARRAWIEIRQARQMHARNLSRSPQGERG